MEQNLKKSAMVLLAFILAISLMLPYGAFDAQVAWADDSTSTPADEDISLTIKAGAATPVKNKENTFSFPWLDIEANSTREIKSITIQFTSPIETGDAISLPDRDETGKFIKYSGSKVGNVSINLAEGAKATADDWENYLQKNLEISLSQVNTTASLRMIANFKPVEAIIDYNSLNGHYYKTVKKNSSISWQSAYEEARNSKYMGMQGYLVTVTSLEENKYVFKMIGEDPSLGFSTISL